MGFKILLDTLNSVNLMSGPCVIAGNFVSFFFFLSFLVILLLVMQS